jgi:STAM-binding protein
MASVTEENGIVRPLSVKEISEQAQNFEWNTNIPFKHWLRTTQTLQQEVGNS